MKRDTSANAVKMVRSLTFIFIVLVQSLSASEVSHLLGVHPDLESLYSVQRSFQCLDGSTIIPFGHVNDDYCDCPDGSDEPGTAACDNGVFYCPNEGHKAQVISSSRVNDGICDCCDGSDEWMSKGCSNECLEFGRAAREEAERQAKITQQGIIAKDEFISRASGIRDEKQKRINEVEEQINAARDLLEDREAKKKDAETVESEALAVFNAKLDEKRREQEELDKIKDQEEASTLFTELDVNGDGKVSKLEMVTNNLFDQNQDGRVSDEEVDFFMSGNEEYSLEDFQSTGWTLVKPLLQKSDVEPKVELNEEHEGDEEEGDFDYPDENEDDDHEDFHEEDEIKAPKEISSSSSDEYDEETRKAVDDAEAARSEYENVNREVRELEKELDTVRAFLDRNYGKDNEYMSLAGECFEYNDAEYTYKACLFEDCTQKPKHGGSETRLGTFQRWAEAENDPEFGHIMYFTGGQQCWNGPARSTTLKIRCGTEVKLVSTSEPSKCEYEMVLESPTACLEASEQREPNHDEL